jgi:hypothetical protein
MIFFFVCFLVIFFFVTYIYIYFFACPHAALLIPSLSNFNVTNRLLVIFGLQDFFIFLLHFYFYMIIIVIFISWISGLVKLCLKKKKIKQKIIFAKRNRISWPQRPSWSITKPPPSVQGLSLVSLEWLGIGLSKKKNLMTFSLFFFFFQVFFKKI